MLAAFPHFSRLSLDDRAEYEQLITRFPPFSDISFTTLHIWWDLEGKLEACSLNGNLVLNYYQSFDNKNSGISLIGHNRLDESIHTVFDFLRQNRRPERLVHVPEFVINKIEDKGRFFLEEELDFNEYILDSRGLASLEDAIHGRTRRKVRRFMREVEGRKVELKELNFESPESKESLLNTITSWQKKQAGNNDPGRTERLALQKTLSQMSELRMRHLGLYIDDELYAIVFYHNSHDNKHYIMNHLKVNYSIPFIFDYMTHQLANKAVQENVDFLNMEMDLGIENLRRHKMGLRPVDFFRKYTVYPAGYANY